jgi:nicotinamide phosphoribosyltransferase
MDKLNKIFKINPLYEADSYKLAHPLMMATGSTREYWTWIPRSLKHMPGGIEKPMSAGQQLVVRYLHSTFQENFFDQPKEVAIKFTQDIAKHLMQPYNFKGFEDLHDLGYLPIKIKSLPEGIFTNPNIPHMTGINTVDGYAWLGLYLETYISKLAWQLPTIATIAHKFKSNAVEWVKKTDEKNLWLADFMCHDFHSRGGNPFSSISVGLGHAMSNSGSDTLNVIPASRYFYDESDDSMPTFSVNASEHSISCTKIFTVGEQQMIADWIKLFPSGILSIVADTFDLWKLITEYLPANKKAIMSRDGKLVIRPDSGDPVDIICGDAWRVQGFTEGVLNKVGENGVVLNYTDNKYYKVKLNSNYEVIGEETTDVTPANKGVIELLWDIFGGTINEQGYKVLNSHIGAIYGDSIDLKKQVEIYQRLEAKGFASSNIVLGVGSYTYIYKTRDSMGFAAKGNWFEVEEDIEDYDDDAPNGDFNKPHLVKKSYNLFKDPITDDGVKKSLKGMCRVIKDNNNEYIVLQEQSEDEESNGELKVIYEDGKFFNQTTLTEIRDRLKIN